MPRVLETEPLEFCMRRVDPINIDAALDCLSKLDQQNRNDITEALSQILTDEAMASSVERVENEVFVPQQEEFQSVL